MPKCRPTNNGRLLGAVANLKERIRRGGYRKSRLAKEQSRMLQVPTTTQKDSKDATAAVPSNSSAGIDSQLATPKIARPKCVRISKLSGGVTEMELKNWLSSLAPSQKSEAYAADSSVAKSSENLKHFCMVRDGGNVQAMATFAIMPAIFDGTEKNIVIEDAGKPWDDAIADVHFEGMTVAYAPPAGTEIKADIVAVTGLDGHALRSWARSESHKVWLRDFLPIDIQHDVRVLLYGYSNALNAANNWKIQFHNLAVSMLDSLKGTRDEKARGRPIIFLGHNLGGLVIEEALVITAFDHGENEDLRDIYDSSTGSILFGVPHEGIQHWELVESAKDRRRESFISDFQTDDTESSEILEVQKRRFKQFLSEREGFKVICYWEEDPTLFPGVFPGQPTTERLLVSKTSATGIGIELNPLEALGISGNNSSMVEFAHRNDEGYKSVLRNIDEMIKKSKPVPKTQDARMQACTDLYLREMNDREQESPATDRIMPLDTAMRVINNSMQLTVFYQQDAIQQ